MFVFRSPAIKEQFDGEASCVGGSLCGLLADITLPRVSIHAELQSLVNTQYARIPPAPFGLWYLYNYTLRFIVGMERQRTALTFILYPASWEYISRCDVFDEAADMKVIKGRETD